MASVTKIFGERRLALLVLLLTAGSQVTAANNEERPTAVARLKPASRRFLGLLAALILSLASALALSVSAHAVTPQIATGFYHTCALTTAGGVKCWGGNLYGELGDNSNTDRLTDRKGVV